MTTMKKILLVLVTLFAIGMTASAQEYRYDQGRKKFVKKTLSYGEVQSSSSLKLSNAATTVWVDGYFKKVRYDHKEIGMVCEGVDKHGNLWVANLTDRRLKVSFSCWQPGKPTQIMGVTEIMDPFEISILRDPKTKTQITDTRKPPYNLNIGTISEYK
jgi:hypothetical protein